MNSKSSPVQLRKTFKLRHLPSARSLITSSVLGMLASPSLLMAQVDPIGAIGQIKGQVILKSDGRSTVVMDSSSVKQGDVVITMQNGSAELVLDGCPIELGANSIFTIREYYSCNFAQDSALALEPQFAPQPILIKTAPPSRKDILAAVKTTEKLLDQPGVLTKRGTWVFIPTLDYTHSSATNVAIEGVNILPSLTVGLFESSEERRNILTGSLNFRYGLSNKTEVGFRVPYTWRERTIKERDQGASDAYANISVTEGAGIGDLELSLRQQFGKFNPSKPYFIGNLRVKSRTGLDIFEMDREEVINKDNNEVIGYSETGQPTGTGFWGIEPSISMVVPAAPATLFASLSYLWNVEREVDDTYGTVDPGDTAGINVGIVYNPNPITNLTIGYEHYLTGKTSTELVTIDADFETLVTGAIIIGVNHKLRNGLPISARLDMGVTDQSEDMALSISAAFDL